MSYTFSKIVEGDFDAAVERVTEELKKEGFGILTEIDIKATLKKKLEVDFRPYKILGACHPSSAYEALQSEAEIGTMLPCNVVVQQTPEGKILISAVDPVASMMAIKNDKLGAVATRVQEKLSKAIGGL